MFETIPQVLLQLLLVFGAFNNAGDDSSVAGAADIDKSSVYVSIFSAALNSLFQVLRLKAESNAVRESFYQYCLECLLARISWIPYENEIASHLDGNDQDDDRRISYNIKYSIPCGISKIIGFEPKISFDFSSVTVTQLITTIGLPTKGKFELKQASTSTANELIALSIVSNASNHVASSSVASANPFLYIDFGKSLRLINFQDLENLLETCLSHNVIVSGFDARGVSHLLSNAINISRNAGKHISNGKNLFGKPYVGSMYSLSSVFENNSSVNNNELGSRILEVMIYKNFNMNTIDDRNGETIIFDLIRNNDTKNFHLMLHYYVKDKNKN